jgi:hypothetical protein
LNSTYLHIWFEARHGVVLLKSQIKCDAIFRFIIDAIESFINLLLSDAFLAKFSGDDPL